MGKALTKQEKERRARIALKYARGGGRTRKPFDGMSLEALAELQCTNKEMAAVLGITVRSFQERLANDPAFRETIEAGREKGKVSLRLLQRRHSEGEGGPAVNMAIHRSKHELGQFDKPTDTHSTVDVNIAISSSDRITAKLDEMRKRMLESQSNGPIIDVTPNRELIESGVAELPPDRGTECVPIEPDETGDGSP